jgi:hypothetical protein
MPEAPATKGTPPNASDSQPGEKTEEECCVRVALQIRPLIEIELADGCQEVLAVSGPAQVGHGQALEWSESQSCKDISG